MATRSVLITGGGSGIGAAAARAMAADGYGVCVAGRRMERVSAVAAEIRGHAVAMDVSRPDDAARAVQECVARFGGLDALVICSGAGAGGAVRDQTLERWNEVISTNLTGAFLVCRAALEPIIARRGAIVTVASLAGLRADPESAA
ncbi:MAG TPA: SDR family NAD(P)-dependent oxidoreductase, partial [Solirubrobacteraceae bacterium]|nr:SDR family NAD(P)-dependent oxidoreductase [Solirubrobacteraceae bacterium]